MKRSLASLFLIAVVSLISAGCDSINEYNRQQEQKKVPVSDATIQAETGAKRFRADFHGEFRGGYDNNPRHIFVITDTCNGNQYLAITGCGTTELKTTTDSDNQPDTKEE